MFTGHIFATSPRTVRGRPTPLKGDPTGKNFLYTNGNSVIIRDIEVSLRFPQAIMIIIVSHRNYSAKACIISYIYAAALQTANKLKLNGRQRFMKISLNDCSVRDY